MRVTEILVPQKIAIGATASSKKRVLEQLSELLAHGADDVDSKEIFERLLARERLGSTSLGKGVAIPHARISSSQYPLVAFMRLEQGIDFDAIDQQPIDLFFALLVPEESTETHLQLLSQLAAIFRNHKLRDHLRDAKDPNTLLEALKKWEQTTTVNNIINH
ncbi:PTS IIA-like nitrogen-regulatory protein PtsN [Candidatus Nitrosoglobus terrae]|uniref:PTS IIA-like nitrogen-regulatory protein PtsN n=1 Tax=Candidatus Nitrosoglobus terrae TaxID=1630141 RepID=A0A1Q2SPC7_9GAMM|nr:PTS sugar transporter subunit IIA [Candidatus Nitrosoglobus terrae]BAW80994.1 PTS IIA-like nitrogen-regulatory protein PtsN [Candidatus Nitrosoglobus terrae]